MTTFQSLVDEVLMVVKGYGLYQSRSSYLTAAATSSDLALSVANSDGFAQGLAEIGDELVFIDSVDRSSHVLNIVPDGRGHVGTTAAAHDANARIDFNPPWPRARVKQAINDTIISTYPVLFGVGSTSFTYNPSQRAYEVPAEAERILSVEAQTIGPSMEPQTVTRYKFTSVANTTDFTTGNALILQEAVSPGRTVTVTYLKAPSALSADTDQLTASGLRETAKLAIIYGACSNLLSFVDLARVPVDTAQADEYDERNQVGTATRIANQLYARHQLEVEAERKRLRLTTPVPINIRNR